MINLLGFVWEEVLGDQDEVSRDVQVAEIVWGFWGVTRVGLVGCWRIPRSVCGRRRRRRRRTIRHLLMFDPADSGGLVSFRVLCLVCACDRAEVVLSVLHAPCFIFFVLYVIVVPSVC